MSPTRALLAVIAMLVVLSSMWRRRRIRRAMRDLPTPMRRLLGPEPLFPPPPADQVPDGLRAYAALHRRTRRVLHLCWAMAGLIAALALISALKGNPT